MDLTKVNDIFGSEMAQKDKRFLDYCIYRDDLISIMENKNNGLLIINAPRGSGKSGLLIQLENKLSKTEKSLTIRMDGASVEYPSGDIDIYQSINFWKTQLLGWIFSAIGDNILFAFSEAEINAVEFAELKGAKPKNIISTVLDKIKFKSVPIEKCQRDPVLRFGEICRLLRNSENNYWLLLDELDDNYDNSDKTNKILAGLLIAAAAIAEKFDNIKIRITIRPHIMKILETSYDKIPVLRENKIVISWSVDMLGEIVARRIESYLSRTQREGDDDVDTLILEINKDFPNIKNRNESLIRLYFQNFDLEFSGEGTDAQKLWIIQTMATISLYRPRWLIEYCKLCLITCNGDGPVSAVEAKKAMYNFGKNRISFLQAEHKSIYSNVGAILQQFSINKTVKIGDSLVLREFIINNIINNDIVECGSNKINVVSIEIARFLYMVDFMQAKETIGTGSNGSYKHHYYVDRPEMLSSWEPDQNIKWVIHPAFANALDLDGNRVYRAGDEIKIAKPKYVKNDLPPKLNNHRPRKR